MMTSLLIKPTAEVGLWKFGNGTGDYSPVSSSTKKETDILKRAVSDLETFLKKNLITPYDIIKIHGGRYQRAGLPDLIILLPKRISIYVEFKRPGADTTALQKRNLEKWYSTRHYCGTANSSETLIQLVKDVLLLENWNL